MDLQELIKKMSLRPGMFVGKPSLRAIYHFIGGYDFCIIMNELENNSDLRFKKEFPEYVKKKLEYHYNIKLDASRSCIYYIERVEENKEKQVKLFFELANNFFKEIAINKKAK